MQLLFLIPVFNDWHSFDLLVQNIDKTLVPLNCRARIVAVNDGSYEQVDEEHWKAKTFDRIDAVDVIDLACNLGHQRAIAVGLASIVDQEATMIIIMDGDGEDDPADLPRLINAFNDNQAQIVMAQRTKRSEGLLFRFFYRIYKLAFHGLTGSNLTFGNYCILSKMAAKRLTYMPKLWNSLPATCLLSKQPLHLVPTNRGNRYVGDPKMNFVDLVLHGLHAITVFSDAVLVRITLAILAVGAVAAVTIVPIRFLTDWVPLGWASNMLGFIGVSLLLILFGLLATSLLTLQERSSAPFIPYIHGKDFVQGTRKLWE